jgi:DNA-binding response OmpR family regulator
MPRILLVEDEIAIADAVLYALRGEGFVAEHRLLGGDGLRALREPGGAGGFDLAILDIGLPDMTGFEVCRELRTFSAVPVIFLTARSGELDKVLGLELGGDDYVVKPFSLAELAARVKSVLRRSRSGEAPAEVVESGDLRIDPRTHTTTLSEREVPLSPKEFALLHFLASHPGQVFSRDTLLDRVWGQDAYVSARTVDVHVRWLREHVEQEPSKPVRLLTVRGVGYKFVA